jgi:alanyl-tRNA synthetase
MTAQELRQKYLNFFKDQGHSIMASASLIPENDPTVLFTTAGMHPLVPYLLGENHPAGQRLVSVQKCIRTGDIDEVGDLTHLTFFEMLGNWSLGDYFKPEAIKWSYEFLTDKKYLGLDKNKLAISVFAGDNDAPFDQESYDEWIKLGIAPERIAKLGKEDNWWGPAGQTGPCGPDTEMFYWVSDESVPKIFDSKDKRWVEIWNDVFMAYGKLADGSFAPLKQTNVDTGMGLERTLCVVNNISDIYQTDLFLPLIEELEKLSGKKYQEDVKAFRIITDHIKAATLIMGDDKGIAPSNTDQGYIVRRLIRRAIRYGRQLGLLDKFWTGQISREVIQIYVHTYPELRKNSNFIITNFSNEEIKFSETLENGLKIINKISKQKTNGDLKTFTLKANELFNLYQTYGFPIEVSLEEINKIRRDNVGIDIPRDVQDNFINLFNLELNKHQELSRTAAAGKFKGGLADHGAITTKLHTATHLLLASLRQVLGEQVFQKGSNITADRLRLDFSHGDKLTPEQIKQVEDLVNGAITQALPVTMQEMSLAEAKAVKAMGVFESKYDERVKVYTVGSPDAPFSREICGGPHVSNTEELGHFKIKKEEASSAGVRRIKAVLE